MKNTIWIFAALLLAACGQKEAETTAVEEAPSTVVESEATDDATSAAETASDETLQVVEESAAVDAEEAADETIMLARAQDPAATREWEFKEGQHFARLVPSQPTWGGADKIEVAEFFWYGCPHCFDFEPYLARWKEQKDPGVRFVKVPAMWNPMLELHAKLFFVEEIFARSGDIENPAAFRNMVFEEYHRRGNRMTSEDAIYRLFERVGVSREDFDKTWNSFEVDQSMRKAKDLARRYNVASVPAIVVNGKYRTSGQEAGSYVDLIKVIDELTEREALR